MAKQSAIRAAEDPNEALGRWIAHRQAAKGEYSKILNERENELLAANASCGSRSSKFQNATTELEEARLERDEIRGVVRRPLNRYPLSFRFFAIFVLVLAVLEGSVNKFLFDVTLASFGFVSYATSFAVAFLVVIAAHFAGKWMRQCWSEVKGRLVWSHVAYALVIIVALASIVSMLTVGRALTAANAGIASFQDMFSAVTTTVAQRGLWGTLAAAYSDLSALVLATVNFAGILVAMMLGVVMHDPDKDFDLAATKVDRHRAELEKLDEQYTKAKTRVISKYASDLSAVSTRYKKANQQVMQLKHRLGLAPDAEDEFLIDEWDDLAETSELGEPRARKPSPEEGPEPRTPHLAPVESPFGTRRA
jgi:hypothetical protein